MAAAGAIAAAAGAVIIFASAITAVIFTAEETGDLIDDAFGSESELLCQHFVGSRGTEVIQTDGEVGKTVPAVGGSSFDGNHRRYAFLFGCTLRHRIPPYRNNRTSSTLRIGTCRSG